MGSLLNAFKCSIRQKIACPAILLVVPKANGLVLEYEHSEALLANGKDIRWLGHRSCGTYALTHLT